MLFNILMNDLDSRTECTLSKFTDDTKQGAMADTPGVVASQTVTWRAGEVGGEESRSLARENAEFCPCRDPRHQYMLGN